MIKLQGHLKEIIEVRGYLLLCGALLQYVEMKKPCTLFLAMLDGWLYGGHCQSVGPPL